MRRSHSPCWLCCRARRNCPVDAARPSRASGLPRPGPRSVRSPTAAQRQVRRSAPARSSPPTSCSPPRIASACSPTSRSTRRTVTFAAGWNCRGVGRHRDMASRFLPSGVPGLRRRRRPSASSTSRSRPRLQRRWRLPPLRSRLAPPSPCLPIAATRPNGLMRDDDCSPASRSTHPSLGLSCPVVSGNSGASAFAATGRNLADGVAVAVSESHEHGEVQAVAVIPGAAAAPPPSPTADRRRTGFEMRPRPRAYGGTDPAPKDAAHARHPRHPRKPRRFRRRPGAPGPAGHVVGDPGAGRGAARTIIAAETATGRTATRPRRRWARPRRAATRPNSSACAHWSPNEEGRRRPPDRRGREPRTPGCATCS